MILKKPRMIEGKDILHVIEIKVYVLKEDLCILNIFSTSVSYQRIRHRGR